ncbi:hypothetical protein GRS48_05470 [Halorubrum sp. JWXQ-INN 858]|uniref:hypothetical protein n=1 Tax=Halorubrum sp. JWXQ-INN 858 TaxID=2690782 RepID=UPI001359A528|nr:hypothetical protein [Halorubrum sp. JWXQ-INN 858]MWV64275.1 hypothetical protein [Halorubrum sp. JWXQ-INN 858]
MDDDPSPIVTAAGRDISTCPVCGVPIEPDPPDGFTRYARQVAGYLDHFTERHPNHEILDSPEGYL